MNENEIVTYLKQNKEKGIAFGFMPEEVKAWCGFHSPDKIFKVYDGVWLGPGKTDRFDSRYVYCLDEDYEPEPQFKPHWEEFEIDEEGCFNFFNVYSFWHQWSAFLALNKDKYNAFGGWLFNDKIWCTNPQLTIHTDIEDGSVIEYVSKDEKCKPAMPRKIRFWRYAE